MINIGCRRRNFHETPCGNILNIITKFKILRYLHTLHQHCVLASVKDCCSVCVNIIKTAMECVQKILFSFKINVYAAVYKHQSRGFSFTTCTSGHLLFFSTFFVILVFVVDSYCNSRNKLREKSLSCALNFTLLWLV